MSFAARNSNTMSPIGSTLVPSDILSDQPSFVPSFGPSISDGSANFPTSSSMPSDQPSAVPSYAPTFGPSSRCPELPPPPPLPGKKGIGMVLAVPWKNPNQSWKKNLPRIKALNVSWNYRWALQPIAQQPDDLLHVPMLWGSNPDRNVSTVRDRLIDRIGDEIANGSIDRIMGFNEPDRTKQADLTVEEALAVWPALESMNLPLLSPSAAKPTGEWMTEFMAAVEEQCMRVDWIGVHWYGGPSFPLFKAQMTNIYRYYGSKRPLWLTEFAPVDWRATSPADTRFSKEQVLQFMKEALPWMERTDWITGYSWFPFGVTSRVGSTAALFDLNGTLTEVGEYYSSVTPDNPDGDQSIEIAPTQAPSAVPTLSRSENPSDVPSDAPSLMPTLSPSANSTFL